MILQEYLEVIPCSKNLKYYQSLGYDAKIKVPILIKNEDVLLKTKLEETRKCDDCGKVFTRTRKGITDTFECYGKDLCLDCSKKMMQEKIKQSNLKKYGVEYPMQSKEIQKKVRQTSLEKYGVEHILQSDVVKQRKKDVFKEKYGVTNPLQVPEIKEKEKQTNLRKYGSENVFGNKDIKKKIKETNLKKYGVENPSQSKEIQNKKEETTFKNYGVLHPIQNTEIQQKCKQTWLNHYGVDNPFKSKEIREKGALTLFNNGIVPTSKPQIKLYELCKTIFPEYSVILNSPLSSLFLDIEIITKEGIKIDLEYDGGYWHQNSQKDRRRDEVVKKYGYKIIRVKSNRLIPDEKQIKEAINYVLKDNHNFTSIVLSDCNTHSN